MNDYTLVRMANSPKRVTIDVGSVIADTYTIVALLGEGGMGQVFLASHLRLPGKQVAIKLLHGGLEDADILRRFAREAEIASRLGHPNIVGVVDTNLLPDGTPYLVLEYLQGESLAQRLKRGPLALPHVLSLVRQIGSALAAAHREGIVHRDLKPQNIFLCPTEVDGRLVEIAKVLDFGISKIRGSDTVKTQESSLLGTPQYMAPEQATGQHSSVDERTDIFALGAILYEMFTGHPAFAGASIPEVVFKVVYEHPTPLAQVAPELPTNVVAAVTRAMAKPAQDRFASVSELVEALTGTPLATLTAPPGTRADFALADGVTHPPASSRGEDAFANTMDSGKLDPAPTPIPPPVIPITPHSATLLGSAPGSTAPAVFTSSMREPASFERDQRVIATVPQTVPAPRRSRTALLALAIGAALIAAIVMVVVMQGDRPVATPPADAARVAEVVPDAAVVAVGRRHGRCAGHATGRAQTDGRCGREAGPSAGRARGPRGRDARAGAAQRRGGEPGAGEDAGEPGDRCPARVAPPARPGARDPRRRGVQDVRPRRREVRPRRAHPLAPRRAALARFARACSRRHADSSSSASSSSVHQHEQAARRFALATTDREVDELPRARAQRDRRPGRQVARDVAIADRDHALLGAEAQQLDDLGRGHPGRDIDHGDARFDDLARRDIDHRARWCALRRALRRGEPQQGPDQHLQTGVEAHTEQGRGQGANQQHARRRCNGAATTPRAIATAYRRTDPGALPGWHTARPRRVYLFICWDR